MAAPRRQGKAGATARAGRPGSGSRDEIRVLNPTLRNGFAQVPSPVMRARGLSHQAVRLYALLLDYSWSDNACFPGQARLAADLDLKSVRSVYSILSELRDYGLIDWHRRPNNSNVYLILDFTQDPSLAIRRTPDGKPYLERVPASAAPEASSDRKKTATPDRTPDRQDPAEPADPVRTQTTEPDRQQSADEVYPAEEYSEGDADGREAFDLASREVRGTGDTEPPDLNGLSLPAIWALALEELRGRLSEASFRNWVVPARPVGFASGRLVIAASSSFARDWLEERLAGEIARAIAQVSGSWHDLRFVARDGD